MNPNSDRLPVPDMNMSVAPNKAPDNASVLTGDKVERPSPIEARPFGPIAPPTSASQARDTVAGAATAGQFVAPQAPQAGTTAQLRQKTDDDDETAIDKECVSKAKAIVQRTSTDPFVQTKELSKVKSELLKRRYGKEFKLSEG